MGGVFLEFGGYIEICFGQSGFVPSSGLCKDLRMLYCFLGILPGVSEERRCCCSGKEQHLSLSTPQVDPLLSGQSGVLVSLLTAAAFLLCRFSFLSTASAQIFPLRRE